MIEASYLSKTPSALVQPLIGLLQAARLEVQASVDADCCDDCEQACHLSGLLDEVPSVAEPVVNQVSLTIAVQPGESFVGPRWPQTRRMDWVVNDLRGQPPVREGIVT